MMKYFVVYSIRTLLQSCTNTISTKQIQFTYLRWREQVHSSEFNGTVDARLEMLRKMKRHVKPSVKPSIKPSINPSIKPLGDTKNQFTSLRHTLHQRSSSCHLSTSRQLDNFLPKTPVKGYIIYTNLVYHNNPQRYILSIR